MWIVLNVIILVISVNSRRLTGDHICIEETRLMKNFTENFIKNATVRQYKWCLNYPPRCSFYTTTLVNATQVVEKEVTDIVESCCSGYQEDRSLSICIPTCTGCINGKCNQAKCSCYKGYKGDNCDIDCGPLEWGENCKEACTCSKGTCDSKTGTCICPSGWSGTDCQSPCPKETFGKDCKEECKCKSHEKCHHITGKCEPLRTAATTVVSITTTSTTDTPKTTVSTTTEESQIRFEETKLNQSNIVSFTNNGRFETDGGLLSTSLVTTERVIHQDNPLQTNTDNKQSINVSTYTSVQEFATNGEDLGDKARHLSNATTEKHIAQEGSLKEIPVLSTTVLDNFHEENYLSDEADRQNDLLPPINKRSLINSASAATAVTVAIIICAIVIVVVNRFRKAKTKLNQKIEGNGASTTVSVYTHSIFHTPLPDPPRIDNPVFLTPIETNPIEKQRIETRVVCSMNFPTHPVNCKDPKEYLYDHPPSTGSYRAASIPEPPDIDSLSSIHMEPLYDEIPSGMAPTPISEPPPSYKASSLYMNTCGKTRL